MVLGRCEERKTKTSIYFAVWNASFVLAKTLKSILLYACEWASKMLHFAHDSTEIANEVSTKSSQTFCIKNFLYKFKNLPNTTTHDQRVSIFCVINFSFDAVLLVMPFQLKWSLSVCSDVQQNN